MSLAQMLALNMDNIEFLNHEWLFLLPVLAIVQLLAKTLSTQIKTGGIINGIQGGHARLRHPLSKLVTQHDQQKITSPFKTISYWIVTALLVIALAEPVKTGERLPDPPRQRDIVFIVDTSVSMVLKDYIHNNERIDRMSVIRSILSDFITNLKGDRVSIVAFADSAHVLVPLSNDTDLLHAMLPRLRTGIAGRSSSLGEAISLAVKQANKQARQHQILVLLTDAALPIGSIKPAEAAMLAAESKLPLYTVVIGAESYAAEERRVTGLVYHPADIGLLQRLAETTQARSYLAGDSASLQLAINRIALQDSHLEQHEPRFHQQPLFYWPLCLAVIILSVAQLGRPFKMVKQS